MAIPMPSLNDAILLSSLTYLSIDMQYQWREFASCVWPVHRWLLVSYILILAFRLTHILGSAQATAGSGDFLLNLRPKDKMSHVLMSLTWFLVLPLFVIWTGLGTYWLLDSKRQSSQCLPMGMPLCFIITWQILSYSWMVIHFTLAGVAWVLERRLRRTESSLRSLEDSDTLARWGQVSQLEGYTALANNSLGGLTPDEIHALPETLAGADELGEEKECSVCLNELEANDAIRQLGGCGHTFHRSCIDLWLLRRADCPLCKTKVIANDGTCPNKGDHWHV